MPFKRGYFIFMAAGYSVGLLMANMAATVMGLAQVSVKWNQELGEMRFVWLPLRVRHGPCCAGYVSPTQVNPYIRYCNV